MPGFDPFIRAKAAAEQTGRQRTEDAYTEQQRNALSTAGQSFAAGDFGAASNALAGAGNIGDALQVSRYGTAQTNDRREQQQHALVAVAQGLRRLPAEQRWQALQTRGLAALNQFGVDQSVIGQITQDHMADADLDAVIAMSGGTLPNAPSGFRFKSDGSLEAIPGGPEAPENQRWQVTPYGLIPPAGWKPEQGGAPTGQSLGSGVPQGWSAAPSGGPPRPNQPPSAPAAGGGERRQPVSVSFPSSGEAQSAIQSIVPGVRVTSGRRSPADNQRVGGASGSFHLQDRARDLVPPQGMSMGQLEAKMRQAGFRVLNEGDHVHVSW